MPADLQPFFAGARLFALEKAQGGIRPIACGEVLRRLVASMAAKQMRAGLLEYLAPGPEEGVQQPAQLGVGARGGSDVMVRGIQAALDAHPDWVCMTVDYTNAFNAGSRAVMLQEVAKRFPSLQPPPEWALGDPYSRVVDAVVMRLAAWLKRAYPGSGRVEVEKKTPNA